MAEVVEEDETLSGVGLNVLSCSASSCLWSMLSMGLRSLAQRTSASVLGVVAAESCGRRERVQSWERKCWVGREEALRERKRLRGAPVRRAAAIVGVGDK